MIGISQSPLKNTFFSFFVANDIKDNISAVVLIYRVSWLSYKALGEVESSSVLGNFPSENFHFWGFLLIENEYTTEKKMSFYVVYEKVEGQLFSTWEVVVPPKSIGSPLIGVSPPKLWNDFGPP